MSAILAIRYLALVFMTIGTDKVSRESCRSCFKQFIFFSNFDNTWPLGYHAVYLSGRARTVTTMKYHLGDNGSWWCDCAGPAWGLALGTSTQRVLVIVATSSKSFPAKSAVEKNKFVLFSSSADTSRRTGNGTGNKTRLKNVSYFWHGTSVLIKTLYEPTSNSKIRQKTFLPKNNFRRIRAPHKRNKNLNGN